MRIVAVRCGVATAIVVGVVSGGSALVGPSAAAGWCSDNRLCFFHDHDSDGSRYMTSDMDMHHDNLTFGNGADVKNNVESVMNRDNQCDVRIIDDRGIYPDDWQDIPNDTNPDNGINWYNLIGAVDNENDRHQSRSC